MSKEYPSVVALVPAYNSAIFIEETLDSLTAQTYPNLRVLISNDASTDGTGLICDRYAQTDDRFRVIHQSSNLGWIGNVNALFGEADGDYFFFAFHDDLLRPDFVMELTRALIEDSVAILAFSDMEHVRADGSLSTPTLPHFDGVTDRFERVRIMAQKPRWNAIPNRGIFRSDAPGLVGGLKRNLAGEFVADWPWLLSLLVHGTFVRVPKVLCRKIIRKSGVASAWNYNPLSRFAVILSCAVVIRRAPFSQHEKWTLYRELFRNYPLHVGPALRNSLKGVRRRLARMEILRRIYFALKNR